MSSSSAGGSNGGTNGNNNNNTKGLGGNQSAPVTFSQVQGNAVFSASATNAVAIIPLLSSNKDGEIATTHSARSYRDLVEALRRYAKFEERKQQPKVDDLLLVVPNSSLTRPGEWRYDNTPLKHFHWGHGCQRILVFDGRPQYSRMAHDRLINHSLTRDWIDICPSRRTAAVIGVLNMRDCADLSTLKRADEELQLWAERYSTPPYEVTAHGRGFERDNPVKRLFVFDSFDEECQKVDLTKAQLGSSILAFPPYEQHNTQMMDLHLNVVVNDLAVAIFQELEKRIKESDVIGRDSTILSLKNATQRGRLVTRLISANEEQDEPKGGSNNLSLNNMNSLISVLNPDDPEGSEVDGLSALGGGTAGGMGGMGGGPQSLSTPAKAVMTSLSEQANKAMISMKSERHRASPQLLTPMDDVFDYSELSAKDVDAMRKREAGRREKFAADLSILSGSPMDAYERYLKAAEMCKSGSPDPLWYASAMEGCAAAHIAMSEAGGYNVDEYLENNFQYPDAIMSLVVMRDKSEKLRSQTASNKPFNKQTLPHVIARLGDEALNITCRHPQTAPFHAELLLKLANYCSDGEQRDLMCRWGQGEGSFGGDIAAGPVSQRRWEKHSLNGQMFSSELKTKDGEDIIANSTMSRCRRFSDLLHRAVSIGALDPVTRVDVATRCVTMCMKGLKPTVWRKPSLAQLQPIALPRKAAFFTAVAAEAASTYSNGGSNRRVGDLWLLASRLYAREGNKDDPNESKTRYGWAALRASTLHALSLCEKGALSSEAAEQLLSLLSEITPDGMVTGTGDDSGEGGMGGIEYSSDGEGDTMTFDQTSRGSAMVDDSMTPSSRGEPLDLETISSLTSRGIARVKNAGIFSQMTATASLLTVQGKWADDEPIPPLQVPLVNASNLCQHVLALSCVWSKVRMEKCAFAQKKIISHIFSLRKTLPSSSLKDMSYMSSIQQRQQQGSRSDLDYHEAVPPLYIASVKVAESESSKILQRIIIRQKAADSNDAMATFFNPFDKKNKDKDNDGILVAEGEERFVSIRFGNRLSVPLEIPSCQIEFGVNKRWRILAPSLSFVIPAKSTNFAIHFPFKPISRLQNNENEGKKGEEVEDRQPKENEKQDEKGEKMNALDTFEMKGLKITSLGKAFFIPFQGKESSLSLSSSLPELPESASEYPRAPQKKVQDGEAVDEIRHSFEVVPSQPRLGISFAGSTLDDNSFVSVYLSDGEIYTTRPFLLENPVSTNGCGYLDRLQIVAAGLPGGKKDETLYDSLVGDEDISADKPNRNYKKKTNSSFEDSIPPLKITALCSGLNLASINSNKSGVMNIGSNPGEDNFKEGNKSNKRANAVSFQIIAANEIGISSNNNSVTDECSKLRLRFRYRGKSPISMEEIWRKREVVLRIVRVKGPRISSLTFRPDLTWGAAYSELCANLSSQNNKDGDNELGRRSAADSGRRGSAGSVATPVPTASRRYNNDPSVILTRVGMDKGVHVCSNDVVVLLSVANETTVDIELSNENGLVGGFEGNPLSSVRVSSGVSVRIPVVLPRIPRLGDGGIPTNIVTQLVSKTGLQWKEISTDSDVTAEQEEHGLGVDGSGSTLRLRQGCMRIPPSCLKEIVARHPSFASRICEPPCSVKISVGQKQEQPDNNESNKIMLTVCQGTPLDVSAEVKLSDWISKEVADRCNITIEFCCARKEEVETQNQHQQRSQQHNREYFWCGQVRKTVKGEGVNKKGLNSGINKNVSAVSAKATTKVAESKDEQEDTEEKHQHKQHKHRARVVILEPGHFVLSACAKLEHEMAFGGAEEIWWTPIAENVIVEKTSMLHPAQ